MVCHGADYGEGRNLLYGVQPFDLLTYATVSIAVAGIALIACWLPARRATRIAPIEALRAE